MSNKMWIVPIGSDITEEELNGGIGTIFTVPTSGVYQISSTIFNINPMAKHWQWQHSKEEYDKVVKSKLYKLFNE